MFHNILSITYYEVRMSLRGWRFWLLLALVTGLSLFARQDYLQQVKKGFFLHDAFSFQHPSFGLMLTVFYLGGAALALDTCGRLRRTGMDKIFFPLPISAMDLMWGRFFGVLILILPLSAFGLFSLGVWQFLYGHGTVIWQPFIIAYTILVLPVLIPVTAIAITMRTFFKHDFSALLSGLLIIAFLAEVGQKMGIFMDLSEPIQRLADTSPTIGVRIALIDYLIPLLAHTLFSVTVLYFAPLYLRRREPQRKVIVRGKRYFFLAVPTFMRWIANLRFDRNLGYAYRTTLALLLLLCTAGGLWAAFRFQERQWKNEELNHLAKNGLKENIPSAKIDITQYEIHVTQSGDLTRLNLDARFDFLPTEPIKQLALSLDPHYLVDKITMDNEPCYFERRPEILHVEFPESATPGMNKSLSIQYHTESLHLYPAFSALDEQWYPEPWRKQLTQSRMKWIDLKDDIFDVDIVLSMFPNQKGAFAGNLLSSELVDGRRIEHWATAYPVDSIQLYWGHFGIVEEEKQGYRIRFFHLPFHDYQARVYLEEVKEQEEYVIEKLGRLPFPQLTIIETPYEKYEANGWRDWQFGEWGQWKGSKQAEKQRSRMPGSLLISENQLCYLHEGIWLLERLDHDPRTIPYYQNLRPTLNYLHDQYYCSLIDVYFVHSLHPSGELGFWLRDYLPTYASKLLEKNIWRKRNELKYDIGAWPGLSMIVAKTKSLLELHQDGQYPALERVRGEGLLRMIHHLLGEEKWWILMKEIFHDYRFQEFPAKDFIARIKKHYEEDLTWFEEDWIYGSALPEYEITFAEAKIVKNPVTMNVDYQVAVTVKNHGTGRMEVPIFIETEMDYVFRNLWLEGGMENTLQIQVPHRPIFAVVDPENWLVQLPFLDKEKRNRSHSEARIYIEGDDRSQSVGRQRQRQRGRRHHFRHW